MWSPQSVTNLPAAPASHQRLTMQLQGTVPACGAGGRKPHESRLYRCSELGVETKCMSPRCCWAAHGALLPGSGSRSCLGRVDRHRLTVSALRTFRGPSRMVVQGTCTVPDMLPRTGNRVATPCPVAALASVPRCSLQLAVRSAKIATQCGPLRVTS